MSWLAQAIDELAAQSTFGYAPRGPGATEPTALAVLALAGHGRTKAARRAAAWIARRQNDDGSVGVMDGQREPCWPTSFAILAWLAADGQRKAEKPAFASAVEAAAGWLLSVQGERIKPDPQLGHDVTLVGWPWVVGTHSWIEPTSMAVLALRALGHRDHPRCHEAVRLLLDRQISRGGCNYGNTVVLGQELLPHVQPTGLALLALSGLGAADRRVARSLEWVRSALDEEQGTPSLCFGLLALAAHGEPHEEASGLLAAAHRRATRRAASGYQLALLANAALARQSPLIGLLAARSI